MAHRTNFSQQVVKAIEPTEVVVSITHVSEESLTQVMEACEEAQVPCRLLRRQIEAVTLAPKVSAE